MKRAISILAVTTALFAASPAAATEHTILILPDAYFPQITYVTSGDTVRFVNMSGGTHDIISEDSKWEMRDIPDAAEVTLSITSNMEETFFDESSESDGAFLMQGELSFDVAPLN